MHWTSERIVAACTLLTLLAAAGGYTHKRLLRPLQEILRPMRQMLDDWHGEPERRGAAGQLIAEARPGVMERLKTNDDRQERIESRQDSIERQVRVVRTDVAVLRGDTATVKEQLTSNGGDSVYDKVTRMAEAVTEGKAQT